MQLIAGFIPRAQWVTPQYCDQGKGNFCLGASPAGLCRGESSGLAAPPWCCPSPGFSTALALQTRDICGYQPAPTIIHISSPSPFPPSWSLGNKLFNAKLRGETTQNRSFTIYLWCVWYENCPKPAAAGASPSQAAAFTIPRSLAITR